MLVKLLTDAHGDDLCHRTLKTSLGSRRSERRQPALAIRG
jgi:hypothetical protein